MSHTWPSVRSIGSGLGRYSAPGVHIRELDDGDLDSGLLESLDALRPAIGTDRNLVRRIYEDIRANSDYLVAVAIDGGMVIGVATLLVERKFIHNGGLAGHIEDVAVSKRHQQHHVGSMLIEYLLEAAKERGCYRTTLDCEDDLVNFYTRLGFERRGVQMRVDHR